MINYYDTQSEINLIKSRIEILKQEKESLKSLVDPKSVVTDRINIQMTPEYGKSLAQYAQRNFEIDKEIKQKTERLIFLEPKLKDMETYLRQSKGLNQKVFVLKYVDGLSTRQIADRLRYSEWNIYRILRIIDRKLHLKSS